MSDAVSDDYLRRELEMLAARIPTSCRALRESARRHAEGWGQRRGFALSKQLVGRLWAIGLAAPPPNSSRPIATLRTCSPSKA